MRPDYPCEALWHVPAEAMDGPGAGTGAGAGAPGAPDALACPICKREMTRIGLSQHLLSPCAPAPMNAFQAMQAASAATRATSTSSSSKRGRPSGKRVGELIQAAREGQAGATPATEKKYAQLAKQNPCIETFFPARARRAPERRADARVSTRRRRR
jgi:hypothetical protein